MQEKGFVFNIQHACDHDGPGIRTSIFLKGCSLKCRWCHNPESWSRKPQILYSADKCIGCGHCVSVCPQNCHKIQLDKHIFERSNCISCGECVSVCPNALDMCGREMSVDEVMKIALEDRVFYESTNGGITITGGEPLEQPNFTKAILSEAKKQGIHTCLETSVNVDESALQSVLPYVDLLLLDYKLTSLEDYEKWTASNGAKIINNIKMLGTTNIPIWLRCPFVPSVHTKSHLVAIADIANNLVGVEKIHVMPYHNLGLGKSYSMGIQITKDEFRVPTDEEIQTVINTIQSKTKKLVTQG